MSTDYVLCPLMRGRTCNKTLVCNITVLKLTVENIWGYILINLKRLLTQSAAHLIDWLRCSIGVEKVI